MSNKQDLTPSGELMEEYRTRSVASLGEARALPFGVYHDSGVYSLEKDSLFRREWVFICAGAELANTGDYFALDLAGEPVLVIRTEDGQLRALSNVCRHRGTILLDGGFGKINSKICCPYHAWTYSDCGELLGVPFSQETEIVKKAHCLPGIRLVEWNGLVFVSLDENAESMESRYDNIGPYLKLFDIHRFSAFYPGATEIWNCNWKIALENAMESYHLFRVHNETLERITPTSEAFYVEGQSGWSITAGKMKATDNGILNWLVSGNEEKYHYYLLICMPPTFVGVLTYESFDWISILPISAQRCSIRSGSLSTPGTIDPETLSFAEAFFSEDRKICERVQRGMSASLSDGGKLLSVERILVDFHQYLGWRLFAGDRPGNYRSANANLFFQNDC